MKVLHLVCNAHLDPVWMWDWDEGACAALSTFYSAAELLDEYDYVFCHNEAVLYQYVEKYAPELFAKIKKAIACGKWHVMGGWYLQPDCMLPSGESFIRQITTGREYFQEKFGVRPTVAVNFDAFGHTRGLVQILKKCGYDGYIFCRPMPEFMNLPDSPFWWKGYDGSKIKAIRINDQTLYSSDLGHAKENILRKVKPFENQESGIALWGVGNHGGGASRKDLADIIELKKEKAGEYEIIHSTPERFFETATPEKTVKTDLPCFLKSYSSI
nr:alpha-mannosidase [Clostridia bacterium]